MLAELRVTPIGGKTSFVRLIADLVPILAESPLQYQVHAMGTTLEGDLEAILELVRRSHEEARKHADRVLIELSLDDRASAEGEIVRGLQHVRDLRVEVPLERLVHPQSRWPTSAGTRGMIHATGGRREEERVDEDADLRHA